MRPVVAKRSFRSREISAIAAICGIIGTAIFVGLFIHSVDAGVRWQGSAVYGFGVVFYVSVFARLSVLGVLLDGNSIKVRNPVSTAELAADQIQNFALSGDSGSFLGLMGEVELEDGGKIRIYGIQAPNPLTRPNNQSAQKLIAELNDQLSRMKALA